MNLPRLTFMDEKCGNLKVVVDCGEVTKNINREKKSDVLQAYRDVHSVVNATDGIGASMIFPVAAFFVGR